MKTVPTRDAYTVDNVARMLGIDVRTLRRYIRLGMLRAMRKRTGGGKTEYRITDREFVRFRRSKFWIKLKRLDRAKERPPRGSAGLLAERDPQLWKRVRFAYMQTFKE